jgi:Flp pilus assembly protein TadD
MTAPDSPAPQQTIEPPQSAATKFRFRYIVYAGFIIVLIAGAAVAGLRVRHYNQARHELQAADDAEARFQYAAAREHILNAAKYWPKQGDVQLKAARMCRRALEFDEAKTYLDAARQLLGQDAVSFEQQLLLIQKGEATDFAESSLYDRSRNDPELRTLVYEALVLGNLQKFRIRGVQKLADEWLSEPTKDPRAWFLRAVAEDQMGVTSMDDQAVLDYSKALELNPDYDEARSRLCRLLLRMKNTTDARKQLEIQLNRHPDDVEALVGFARCAVAAGENESARQSLDKALKGDPKNTEALRDLGILNLNEGNAQDSEPLLRQAVELNSNDLTAIHNYALCLRRLGQTEVADRYQTIHDTKAALLDRMEQAKRKYQEVPRDPDPSCTMGECYIELGGKDNEERGLWWLEQARRLDPKHVRTLQALAAFCERHGRPDMAENYRNQLEKIKNEPTNK